MREFTVDEITTVVTLHNKGISLRKIEELIGIPKSVSDRWIKAPEEWKQRYQSSETWHIIKDKDRRMAARNRLRKFLKRQKTDTQKGLRIRYDEVDDYVVIDS